MIICHSCGSVKGDAIVPFSHEVDPKGTIEYGWKCLECGFEKVDGTWDHKTPFPTWRCSLCYQPVSNTDTEAHLRVCPLVHLGIEPKITNNLTGPIEGPDSYSEIKPAIECPEEDYIYKNHRPPRAKPLD